MSTEKKLTLIEAGKISDTLLNLFRDRIRAQKDKELKRLTTQFAQDQQLGKATDPQILAARVAAYCAIEGFESELDKEVAIGRKASSEVYGNPIR